MPLFEGRYPERSLIEEVWREPQGFQCLEHRNSYVREHIERTLRTLPPHRLPPGGNGATEANWVVDTYISQFQIGGNELQTEANMREFAKRIERAIKYVRDHGADPLVSLKRGGISAGHYTKGKGLRARLTSKKVTPFLEWYVGESGAWYKAVESHAHWGGEVSGSELLSQRFEPVSAPTSSALKAGVIKALETRYSELGFPWAPRGPRR
jgi:hypothetical protein